MNELAVKNDVIQQVSEKTLTEYLDTTGLTKQLLPKEKAMFVNMARDYGLNPFKREIYCTVYGEGKYRQCSIVTGYEVYLKRAERTGKLDGWHVEVSGKLDDGSLAATVTIFRKDWSHPFQHTVYYTECVQRSKQTGEPNAIWKKMPIFMTKKVAIAQSFRLCFSDEFGGMPYTNDELGVEQPTTIEIKQEDVQVEIIDEPPKEEISENRKKLGAILTKYETQIDKVPYEMCCKAMSGTDENDVTDKLNRVISYLDKKGIKVV